MVPAHPGIARLEIKVCLILHVLIDFDSVWVRVTLVLFPNIGVGGRHCCNMFLLVTFRFLYFQVG